MLARIATAAVLIPAVIALIWWGPAELVAAGAAGVALLALVEFFNLGEHMGLRAFRKWTMACAAGIFYAQYSLGMIEKRTLAGGAFLVRGEPIGTVPIEAVLLIFLFGAAGIALATRRALHEILPAISVSAAGLLFVVLPFSYLVRINEIEHDGRALVLFTMALMWAGDTFAYFIGRSLGRLPMAPALSPKKTWEGALANMAGSLLVGMFFARWMHAEAWTWLAIAALANIAGQMGDLVKSAYKRGAGVKDSGSILPGHGGVLDRIDSLILASPVVWVAYQNFIAR
jgi:phosphatidate cytidylyltransferase